ncbi:MAG: hypothetical protein AAB225_18655 [Acidobacteriota bacterium]
MRNRIWTVSTLILLLATFAWAQSSITLEAKIPFEFRVGKAILPGGDYTIHPNLVPGAVALRNTDRSAAAIVLTLAAQANKAPERSKLVFNRYGDTYFLAQVWHAGNNRGIEVRKTKAEREMARNVGAVEVAAVYASQR